ncbi:hypothetical protein ACS5NO_29680 [Larkinella sp. GY13]|uniref:hypothetical protein n=1 Tax=Larkinella sp. GY13 TaxID=3453720 RepID=UPI003EEA98AD
MARWAEAQSGSTGSTFVHTGGQMGIFGQHDFQNGSGTINAGIIGSERQPAIGMYTFVNPNASWVGASSSAFVDGYVRTLQSGPFTFPIGDNNAYRPAAVSASSSANPTTAAYFGVDPGLATTSDLKGGTYGILPGGGPEFPTTSKAPTVGVVDNVEYWDIDGTTPARITLTWDANTPISAMIGTDFSKLTIVGWDGAKWVTIPSTVDPASLVQTTSASAFTGLGPQVSAGSITTDADVVPGSFIVYTLAGIETICSLTVTASASSTAVCVGQVVTLASTVTGNLGAVTYAWSGPNGFTGNAANPTLPAATSATSGLYTVTVSDPTSSTSCIRTASVAVNVGSLGVLASSNSPVCSGGTLALYATVPDLTYAPFTYAWTGPNSFASNQPNPTIVNPTANASGNYVLVVTATNGCSGSATTAVVITDAPDLSFGLPNDTYTICSGSPAQLTVSGSNGATVTWQASTGQTGTGTTIDLGTIINNASEAGIIKILVNAQANGCQDNAIVYIKVKPIPILQLSPTVSSVCDLEMVTVQATALLTGATIDWTRTPNTPNPPPASGTGTTSVLLTQTLPPATYTYNFTTTYDGCTSSPQSVTVTVQQ